MTWYSDAPPPAVRIGAMGWLRAGLRGMALAVVLAGGVVMLVLFRLVERPLWGMHRPVTPTITRIVCRAALGVLGIGCRVAGRPMTARGALVANHSSWLDILALNATGRLYFVSKSEVAGWPGIGALARLTGTVFIRREAREARGQTALLAARLRMGHRLLFFPEGTSTDGLTIVPFKTALFEAFLTEEMRPVLCIQPVSVVYRAPPGEDPRFYGWWGGMDLGPHLLQVLAARRGGVEIAFHDPLNVCDFPDRKALARACEAAVRQGHAAMLARAETEQGARPRPGRS